MTNFPVVFFCGRLLREDDIKPFREWEVHPWPLLSRVGESEPDIAGLGCVRSPLGSQISLSKTQKRGPQPN